mmetsp:Transcript_13378/g.27197  ORF Transcript_13378/g.27197 Transcript_13378/m.27197 type:complete len:353 (-) Transcript_13378:635-1693(-)
MVAYAIRGDPQSTWGFVLHPKLTRIKPRVRLSICCLEKDNSPFVAPVHNPPSQPSSAEHNADLFHARGLEVSPGVALHLATLLWGSQHAVIKNLLSDMTADQVNLDRFLLAALVFTPFLPRERSSWSAAAELSFWMFLGYAFQSIGLLTTTASRSCFLLYLNVKLVPLLARVLEGRAISSTTWTSAGIAAVGTLLLAFDGGQLPNAGDGWSLLAASASAMFILRLSRATQRVPSPARLNAALLWLVTAWNALWGVLTGAGTLTPAPPSSASSWASVLYLAVATTALSSFLQSVGQRSMSPERAALIYALDPVYGAVFAYFLLGENLGPQGVLGAFLISGAAVLSAISPNHTS